MASKFFTGEDSCRLIDIHVVPHAIEKLLRNLLPDKAEGAAEVSPRLLAEISKGRSTGVAFCFS